MTFKLVAFIFLATLLTGCTKKTNITYYSNPTGAEIFEGDKSLGHTPMTKHITWDPQEKIGGCAKISPVEAVWINGVSVSNKENLTTVCKGGNYTQVFERPDDNLENKSKNIAFSQQLERNKSAAKEENRDTDYSFWLLVLNLMMLF